MRTSVRLVSAPPLEPPYDDQLGPDAAHQLPPEAGAQLTLQWSRRDHAPVLGSAPVAAPGSVAAPRSASSAAHPPANAGVRASQPAVHAALRFLSRCQEILNGYRPVSHIRPLAATTAAQTIVDNIAAVVRRTARPYRAAQAGGQQGMVARRRVHVCEPRAGVAEAMAVLTQGSRSWAIAFRLERRGIAWLCTAFTDVTQRP